MSRMDVGGNGALALQEYTAYGLRATTGVNRNEVEGIRVGGANGAQDNYFSDFASFAEIADQGGRADGGHAGAGDAGPVRQQVRRQRLSRQPVRGLPERSLEATNIDSGQIARGVSGGPGLDARDVNRLERFRDFNADVGGFLKKNKAWWYGAYRSYGGRATLPVAARHGCHAHGDGRDRQADLPAVAAAEARWLRAARDFQAVELFHCQHQPADPDERCPPEPCVSRERVESRVQRRRDRRGLRRSARRRLSFRRRRDVQEHGAAHCSTLARIPSVAARWRRSDSSTVRRPTAPSAS